MNFEQLASDVEAIVTQAGILAAKGFRHGQKSISDVWYKQGGSPVTSSDIAANDLLRTELCRLLPQAGWLSEETTDNTERLTKDLIWVVDPIDGTRAFVSGHVDWCVSVGLLSGGVPIIGSIFAPALQLHYRAIRNGGAYRNGQMISVAHQKTLAGCKVAGPLPMIAKLEQTAGRTEKLPKIPSLALRLARVAEGVIDIGLVSKSCCDWDIAAADLILQEAGGLLTGIKKQPIIYNNAFPVHGELAASSKLLHSSLIEALT